MNDTRRFCKIRSSGVEILRIPLGDAVLSACEITYKGGKGDLTDCAQYCVYSYPFQMVTSLNLASSERKADGTFDPAIVIERGDGRVQDFTLKITPTKSAKKAAALGAEPKPASKQEAKDPRSTVVVYRIVPGTFGARALVALACSSCGWAFQVKLEDFDGTFRCRECGRPVTIPRQRVPCSYAGCSGTYERCGGLIHKLPPAELAAERASAWAQGPELGGGPTDSNHEDYGDTEGSILTYYCTRCGKRFTFAYGVSHYLGGERAKCERVFCGRCQRVPAAT